MSCLILEKKPACLPKFFQSFAKGAQKLTLSIIVDVSWVT
jgi:hypothetical protein